MTTTPADAGAIPRVQLAISGMASLTNSMAPGGLYVMIAATPSARFPILASSIGDALDAGIAVNIVVPANPGLFLDRIASLGRIDTAPLLAAQRLGLFEMQDEFPKKMFRYGADRFVREMEQLDIPERSYLVFDQADELLALHDLSLALDQVEVLGRWLALRGITALLVFTRTSSAQASTINALMDSLTGIFHLGGDRDGLVLTYDYWKSQEGAIAARSYRLNTLESGYYEASTRITPGPMAAPGAAPLTYVAEAPLARDTEERFFYMDPALAAVAGSVPGIWQRVDTLVGMLHATQQTRTPTCLLSFEHHSGLRQLAQAVHTLRLSVGRGARIVVLEKGVSLRYQNEALLLRLGVNLVVHRDVPNERLPLLLDSLSGQVFSRDVDINFEDALASVMPARLRGYLAPHRFAREAATVIDRAQPLHIPCALISGIPLGTGDMADLIAATRLARPGDLITSDGERCLLFLNACPQAALLSTLQRILGCAPDELLGELRFMTSPEEIVPALTDLAARAAEPGMPDYAHLAASEAPAEPEMAAPELPAVPEVVHLPVHTPARSSAGALERAIAEAAALARNDDRAGEPAPEAPGTHYTYDHESNKYTFGKKTAPRATRSAHEGHQA